MAPSSVSLSLFVTLIALQNASGQAANVTTVSGYLVDFYCYRLGVAGTLALDGTDVIKRPWTHTLHCLRDPPQCYLGGYYVAVNMGTTLAGPSQGDGQYVPKFMLDAESSDKALALLRTYPKGHEGDNVDGHFLVTAVGTVNAEGIMSATSVMECSGEDCDGKCTGECGVTFSGDGLLQVPVLLWLHVVRMVSSWGFLLPLGVVFAMNLHKSEFKVSGIPIWFFGHRTLQIVGWSLQLVGFAAILAHKGANHFSAPHEVIGLIVVIVGSLQPVNAQLRHLAFVGHPGPNGERTLWRTMWERLHKGLGYFALFGGILNVCFGTYYAWVLSFGDGLVPLAAASFIMFAVCWMAFALFARLKLNKACTPSE